MTTYDTIYTHFLTISNTDPSNLPKTNEKIYDLIHSAIHHFNNRMRDTLEYDDTTEKVSRELIGDELILLARFLRLSFLQNQLTYFSTLYQPFEKDIGIKNYQAQVKSLEQLIENEKKQIDEIVLNMTVDFL